MSYLIALIQNSIINESCYTIRDDNVCHPIAPHETLYIWINQKLKQCLAWHWGSPPQEKECNQITCIKDKKTQNSEEF